MNLVVLFLLVVADGIVPPIPSEAVLLAHAPGAVAQGWVAVAGLWALAAVGAFLGDVITYSLGRGIGTRRFAWQRRAWVARVLDRTGVELDRRGAPLILSARLLPGWRVAITFLAGATRMAPARFFLASACGASMWAAYMIGIGATVGALTGAGPFVVACVSLVVTAGVSQLVRVLRSGHHSEGYPSRHGNPRRSGSAHNGSELVRNAGIAVAGTSLLRNGPGVGGHGYVESESHQGTRVYASRGNKKEARELRHRRVAGGEDRAIARGWRAARDFDQCAVRPARR